MYRIRTVGSINKLTYERFAITIPKYMFHQNNPMTAVGDTLPHNRKRLINLEDIKGLWTRMLRTGSRYSKSLFSRESYGKGSEPKHGAINDNQHFRGINAMGSSLVHREETLILTGFDIRH